MELEEYKRKIEDFRTILKSLSVCEYDHYRQLQEEFNQLSTLPEHIRDMRGIKDTRDVKGRTFAIKDQKILQIVHLHQDFIKQCRITQSLLNSILLKIHDERYCNGYISDFNYLYSDEENLNGTEIYIYDLKSNKRTSICALKSYKPKHRLLDKISNIIKISNCHLLIIGTFFNYCKGFLMDLKSKAISEVFEISDNYEKFGKESQFIYHNNYIYVFGISFLEKYNINRKKWLRLSFPNLRERVFSVLFQNYILISNFANSNFYLYDLTIEAHSEITFFRSIENRKFLFTDQVRAYLGIQNGFIYESDINNPFKWNTIGNFSFGIRDRPYNITFSNFEENIYASFIIRPHMFFYKFNRERIEMELIYKDQVNS